MFSQPLSRGYAYRLEEKLRRRCFTEILYNATNRKIIDACAGITRGGVFVVTGACQRRNIVKQHVSKCCKGSSVFPKNLAWDGRMGRGKDMKHGY
jgi:hypothetical protein